MACASSTLVAPDRNKRGNALADQAGRMSIGTKAPVLLIGCNGNLPLAEAIAAELGLPLCAAAVRRFADTEVFVEIHETVRGQDTFVIQSTCAPANDHVMELLITVDALRRGSARRITAVIPYFGYARQDRKTGPRTPITAKLVAKLLAIAGVDRILTLDLHAMQIQGFFDIPVDNLYAAPLFSRDIKARHGDLPVMIVSPDVGGVVRARQLAQRLNTDLAIVDKRRERPGVSEVVNVIGDVGGRHCILVDDIVDSGGSLANAARAVMERGALSVEAYVTHGVLSGEAVERLQASPLTGLTLTDSIAATTSVRSADRIRQITVAGLFSRAVRAVADEASVSSLFE